MCIFTNLRVLPQLVVATLREVSYEGYLWTPFVLEMMGVDVQQSGVIHMISVGAQLADCLLRVPSIDCWTLFLLKAACWLFSRCGVTD